MTLRTYYHLFLVFITLVVHGSIQSQGSWELMQIPTTKNLISVSFVDSLTGWVVGDSGIIMHTMDGGQSWEVQESRTNNNIIDVFFLNSEYGWAASR